MHTPVNPIFTIILLKWGVRGSSLHGIVFVMDKHNVNECHTGEFYTFSYSYSLLEFEYKIQETSSVNSNPGFPKRLISFGYKQVNLYLQMKVSGIQFSKKTEDM